ncbi:S1 family peptidase [Streptomyces sp. NPDC059256]|uniref:S1 family peptidase n=1 Tax=Streptomyces sp. NPDC059256 TaxID=3346794 RepID=UPI0036A29D08
MTHRRIPKRKAALAGAAAISITAAAVLLPQAYASQDGSDAAGSNAPKTMSATSAADLLKELDGTLGDSYGGAYYDAKKKRLVVNIAGDDSKAVERVTKAGAVAREVRNSASTLLSARRTLAREATIPGTSWALDPRTNQVLVMADRTVTGERWDRLETAVQGLGPGVARIKKSAGEFKTFLEGGDAIFGGGARCSLGFNVTLQDGGSGFLTAGHCAVAAERWSETQGGAPVGTVRSATFPGAGDFALVTYDDPATQAPSSVDVGGGELLAINRVVDATVGQEVARMGSTTGLRNGQVTGLDATVNYPEGTVTGLIQTNVCAEPGDSGGALFGSDGSAIGLTSGGSGNCTSGGETFFQPVTTALTAVGAQIGDGTGSDTGGGEGGEEGADQGADGGGEGGEEGADQGADGGGEGGEEGADQGADGGGEGGEEGADQGADGGGEGGEEGADQGADGGGEGGEEATGGAAGTDSVYRF